MHTRWMRMAALVAAAGLSIAAVGHSGDRPEITRSLGRDGGVVVLWPRAVPESTDANIEERMAELQQRMVALAQEALPGRTVDVRPEPQRACPRSTGCKAVAISAMLAHQDAGCAAVLLATPPGKSDMLAAPWAGQIKMLSPAVPFRTPPEAKAQINDLVACDQMAVDLDAHHDELVKLIQRAAETSSTAATE